MRLSPDVARLARGLEEVLDDPEASGDELVFRARHLAGTCAANPLEVLVKFGPLMRRLAFEGGDAAIPHATNILALGLAADLVALAVRAGEKPAEIAETT